MPTFRISPSFDMHYVIDEFTDPWIKAETILLLHGNSESGRAWYGWVPHMARQYRLVRPDMRGFGKSTPMARDFKWTLDVIIRDYAALMDMLQIEKFHIVAAKIGGIVGRAFAARLPERVQTLTLVGVPPPSRANKPPMTAEFERHGVGHWAARTMKARLGDEFPPEGLDWWTQFMGGTAVSSQVGFMTTIPYSDIRAEASKIDCPSLVITTEGSGLASVEDTRAWQMEIPNSRLVVLPGNSHHVAASAPDRCAKETLAFLSGQAMAMK